MAQQANSNAFGVDFSVNAPTGPGAATSFTYNGSTINLLLTIPANQIRRAVEINNTTGALIVVVIDDSANGVGFVSLLPLEPGSGQYRQGSDVTLANEAGRIRVFGTTGTFCYAREI